MNGAPGAERRPVLIIVCGLPGSGKTTMARHLADERGGIRLSPDDWMQALEIDLWDSGVRDKVERLQWALGRDLLRTGNVVIVEWGTWGRDERTTLREEARALGAQVELVMLDPPVDELYRRITGRGQEDPAITLADLEQWDAVIQRPDAAELAGYDAVIST